jgi:hypothetical protein
MTKKICFVFWVVSLTSILIWRPAVPAVLEDSQVSFFSTEAMPLALSEVSLVFPPTAEVWFEQLDERGAARCSASYLVTSFERPPPGLV